MIISSWLIKIQITYSTGFTGLALFLVPFRKKGTNRIVLRTEGFISARKRIEVAQGPSGA